MNWGYNDRAREKGRANSGLLVSDGGWGGIRTHEALASLPVFKTGAFNRSTTHPWSGPILGVLLACNFERHAQKKDPARTRPGRFAVRQLRRGLGGWRTAGECTLESRPRPALLVAWRSKTVVSPHFVVSGASKGRKWRRMTVAGSPHRLGAGLLSRAAPPDPFVLRFRRFAFLCQRPFRFLDLFQRVLEFLFGCRMRALFFRSCLRAFDPLLLLVLGALLSRAGRCPDLRKAFLGGEAALAPERPVKNPTRLSESRAQRSVIPGDAGEAFAEFLRRSAPGSERLFLRMRGHDRVEEADMGAVNLERPGHEEETPLCASRGFGLYCLLSRAGWAR